VFGDGRIGPAEAVGQFGSELRAIGVAHDRRRHRRRPAEVVAFERLQQLVDVHPGKATDVARVVQVSRRWPHQHQRLEASRVAGTGKHADHRAHGVTDEDHVLELQLATDLQDILRVAIERAVLFAIVGSHIGPASADVIEQHDAEAVLEGRRHEAPHVLIAAETVREQHALVATAGDADVIALGDGHRSSRRAA
jgi:hypothetical protein